MKITDLEILQVPPSWVWLRIHTDCGLTGLGEPYLENHATPVIAEVERLAPFLIGEDPTRVEALWQKLYNSGLGYVGGPVKMSALSGIDIALWDLAGKAAGVPIYQLLGGPIRTRIKMYRSVAGTLPWVVQPGEPYRAGHPPTSNHAPGTPASYTDAARALVEEWGFRALKAHFSLGDGLTATREIDGIAEKFAAVRQGAGPDIDIAVDIHNPHPAIAKQLIDALAPYRPLFVEEAMPVERTSLLLDIAHDARVPIAAGERWMGKWVFYDALSEGSLAVLQPDICHAGGITECRKIAAIGEAAYAKLALHCPLSPLALAASLQLDATVPNFLVQEHNEVNDWRENGSTMFGKGYFKEPFILEEDGCVQVPQGPGLGIELDQEMLGQGLASGDRLLQEPLRLLVGSLIAVRRGGVVLEEILLPLLVHPRQAVDLGLELQLLGSALRGGFPVGLRLRFQLLQGLFEQGILDHLLLDDRPQLLERDLEEEDRLLHLRREDHPLFRTGQLLESQGHKISGKIFPLRN